MRRYTVDDVKYTIGQNIKKARKAKGLTQKQLGEMAGMSSYESSNGHAAICHVECGINFPYPKTLVRIADALEVDVFDFFKKLE